MPAFHTVTLDGFAAPSKPSIETLAALTAVAGHPVRNVCVAQDTLVGPSRRTMSEWGLRGADTWPWDETSAIEFWPTLPEYRVVQPLLPVRFTPGSYLRLKVLFVPSGNTRDVISVTADHPEGWIRITTIWQNGFNSSGPDVFELQLPPAAGDGLLPAGESEVWGEIRELDLIELFPPDVDDESEISVQFCERTRALVQIEIRGGIRVIDGVLVEHPLRHTQSNITGDAQSCHGAVQGAGPPLVAMSPVPVTDRRNPALFNDDRFGSLKLLRTAHEQSEALGPKVLTWNPWLSDDVSFAQLNSLGENDVEPVQITGTTDLVELVSGFVGYDEDQPGWIVAASYAQLHRFCDPDTIMVGGGRAVIPVRVQVRARWTGASGSGIVRFQSSETEWVDVEFADSGVLETIETVGWLESQVAGDQATAVLQGFGQNTAVGDTLEVYGTSIDWNWRGLFTDPDAIDGGPPSPALPDDIDGGPPAPAEADDINGGEA